MNEDIELDFLEAEEQMQKAVDNYKNRLVRINAGTANPMILNSIKINYYETLTPINQLASISISEGRQLIIKPYDIAITKNIVSAINTAALGVNAKDEGDKARINFPIVTREKRILLVKQMATYTEEAKISIRKSRQTLNKKIKNNDLGEDLDKEYRQDIQKLTDKYILKIEKEREIKEKDLLTI